MKRSIKHNHSATAANTIGLVVTVAFAAILSSNPASAQSSLPGYGKGYGFSGGVGWGTLPSTPPTPGTGYSSQFRGNRIPIQTYRVPTQLGNLPYSARRYNYGPYPGNYRYGAPIYGNGYAPYGYGYSPYGVQLNSFPGGIIQSYHGPIRW